MKETGPSSMGPGEAPPGGVGPGGTPAASMSSEHVSVEKRRARIPAWIEFPLLIL